MPSLAELGEKLQQTWPAKLLNSLYDAATLPGDVYSGRTAVVDPETGRTSQGVINRSADLAGLAMTGGVPMAEAGAVGSSAGRLFHGSPKTDLSVLEESVRGPFGAGVYASPHEGVASRYAGPNGRVYELAKDADIFHAGRRMPSEAEYAAWKDDQKRLIGAAEPERRTEVERIVGNARYSDGYEIMSNLQRLYGGYEAPQELLKRAGFQGVSGYVDGPEVLLFGKQPVR